MKVSVIWPKNRGDTEVITDIARGSYHVLEISEIVGLKSTLASARTSTAQSIECAGCVALPCTTCTNMAARSNMILMNCFSSFSQAYDPQGTGPKIFQKLVTSVSLPRSAAKD